MISGLNHITLQVSDLDRAMSFYVRLGFKGEVRWKQGAYLSCQELWLCLSLGEVTANDDYSHLAFSVAQDDFERAQASLMELGTEQWQTNQSEGDSLYFLDPDGHKLEIHVGSLQSRLALMNSVPKEGQQWL